MATTKGLMNLEAPLRALAEVDWERVRRANLGDVSLSIALKQIEKDIQSLEQLARKYSVLVHDRTVGQIVNTIQPIVNELNSHAQLDDAQYVQDSKEFLESLKTLIEKATLWKPIVASAAMLDSGLLEAQDFMTEIKRERVGVRREAEKQREAIRDEATKILDEAKAQAKKIEGKARDTAAGISVEAAQEQFKAASDHDAKQVRLWTALATMSIVILIGGACLFLFADCLKMPEQFKWNESLPQALLRIFVLSALAGAATFTFRMLRAHLHIAEKNRHRVRVANCIEGFLQAAGDASQRDLILAKLTDSIVNYGDSGLVQHDREDRSPTMSADLMGRIVAAISRKGSR